MIKCELYSYGVAEHTSQICTGYSLLAQKGNTVLKQHLVQYSKNGIIPMKNISPEILQGMFVKINSDKIIYYDCSDAARVMEEAAEMADFYFKRSYLEEAIPERYKHKVFPLGLNVPVYNGFTDKFEFARFFFQSTHYIKDYKKLVKYALANTPFSFLPTVQNIHLPPKLNQDPKVIFMARTWETLTYGPEMPLDEVNRRNQDKISVTEMRAAVIARLRKELGNRFYGGFSHSPHAVKNYKNLLVDTPSKASKKNYIALLGNFPICIATTGIFGSIGWKFAEYISLSKSIVSEKLNYQVPGDLSAGKNYLEFSTADQCVEQTMVLFEDKTRREQMMEDNYAYYKEFLAPDKLIQRTLEIALSEKPLTKFII